MNLAQWRVVRARKQRRYVFVVVCSLLLIFLAYQSYTYYHICLSMHALAAKKQQLDKLFSTQRSAQLATWKRKHKQQQRYQQQKAAFKRVLKLLESLNAIAPNNVYIHCFKLSEGFKLQGVGLSLHAAMSFFDRVKSLFKDALFIAIKPQKVGRVSFTFSLKKQSVLKVSRP